MFHPASRRLIAALVLCVAAASMLASASSARAANNGAVSLKPADENDFFRFSLVAGAAEQATAIARNETATFTTLQRYAVDGTATPNGTFVLAAQTATRTGVGAWVKLDATPLVLPAHSESRIPFTLSVPVGTPPGDYAGGLIVQTPPQLGEASAMGNGDTLQMSTVQRIGVRIYLTVAGTALPALRPGALTWQRSGDTINFALPVHNTGNTIVHPVATLGVKSEMGVNTQLTFSTPESVLPGGSLTLHATLSQLPLFQQGTATATLPSEAGVSRSTAELAFAPWGWMALWMLGVAAIAYLTWRVARFVRNNWHLINWQ